MILNPSKTKSMTITTRQKHQLKLPKLNLTIQSKPIEQVATHRLLGVTIDEQLKWEPHIKTICDKVSKNIFLLSKLKYYLNFESRKLFFHAHIKSHIDYASTIWDRCADVHLIRLNSLYRRAAKHVCFFFFFINLFVHFCIFTHTVHDKSIHNYRYMIHVLRKYTYNLT